MVENATKSWSGWLICALVITSLWPAQGQARRRNRATSFGALVIQTMTDEARIFVDDKLIGRTPFKRPIRVRTGTHKLKATKPGFDTVEMEFVIRKNQKTSLELELFPHSGLVKFGCNVAGAEVYVDGKLVGKTPLIRQVVVGDHKIYISKEGYNDFESAMNVKAGEKHFVEAQLSPYRNISPEVLAEVKAHEEAEARKKKLAEAQLREEQLQAEQQASPPSWTDEWYKQWWIWALAGAVVATAVTVPLVIETGQPGLNAHDPAAEINLP
jgi:hypothetical protein